MDIIYNKILYKVVTWSLETGVDIGHLNLAVERVEWFARGLLRRSILLEDSQDARYLLLAWRVVDGGQWTQGAPGLARRRWRVRGRHATSKGVESVKLTRARALAV